MLSICQQSHKLILNMKCGSLRAFSTLIARNSCLAHDINITSHSYPHGDHNLSHLTSHSPNLMFVRSIKWKTWPNDFLPFIWVRPEKKIGYLESDDLVQGVGTWDPNALILEAQHSEALKNAPEEVRKQFTLEFAHRKDILEFQYFHILKHMQRHPFDIDSPEARVTRLTVKIRNLLEHFKKHPDEARAKISQNVMIQKRRKILKLLYYQDYERFKYIVDTLKIDYTPPPLGRQYERIERKREMRRLTKQYCDNIIEEKLMAYQKKLEAQQQEFLNERKEIEDWIAKEEKYLGTTHNEADIKK